MRKTMHGSIQMFLVVLLALGLWGGMPVQAAPTPTFTWIGKGNSSDWLDSGNWDPGLPVDGANLYFPATAYNKTNHNNLSKLAVSGIAFQSGGYQIDGNLISLSTGIGNAAGNNVLNLPIALRTDVEANVVGNLYLDGVISQSGGNFKITKTGTGNLSLGNNSNTFSGGIGVNDGQLTLTQPQAGGSGLLDVSSGSTLLVVNPSASLSMTLANPLRLNGTGSSSQGALHYNNQPDLTLSGPVNLSGSASLQSTAGIVRLGNAVSGSGDLTLDGPEFWLAGDAANTFTGTIKIPHGILTLSHSPGSFAVPGNLIVGPGDGINPVGVDMQASDQFSPLSQVSLGKYATFNLKGFSQTLGGMVAWDRPCQIMMGGGLTVTLTFITIGGPQNYVFCDVIGTGTLLVKGKGLESFGGNDPVSPFYGTLEVQKNAASYLDGFQSNGLYYIHGLGSGGGLYPGSKVGDLIAENSQFYVEMTDPSSMSQAGSVLLTSAFTIFALEAANAGGLKVSGSVNLGNAQLFACYSTGFEPTLVDMASKQRTLIQNNGAYPIAGTFAGLAEGAETNLTKCMGSGNTYPIRISYQGGDGNDVVMTRLIQDSLNLQFIPPTSLTEPVVLTAVLTPLEVTYGAALTNKAAFYDGNQFLGEASFSGMSAVLNIDHFYSGSHTIQARLVGDPNYADANSQTITFHLGKLVFVPIIMK